MFKRKIKELIIFNKIYFIIYKYGRSSDTNVAVLGAMYIISNKKEKKKNPVESFTQRQYLPNVKPIVKIFQKILKQIF